MQLEKLQKFQKYLQTLPQVIMPVEHSFCNGLYARTMHIPKGTVLTGAIHASENFFVVRQGEITVLTEFGPKRLTAGDMLVSKRGDKRAGVAHDDVIVTTFHYNPDNIKDPEELWELYVIPEENVLDMKLMLEIEAQQ